MKKAVWFLLLAGCLLLSACTALQSIPQTPTPTPIHTPNAISSATPADTPSQPTASRENDPFSWVSEEYIADQIAAAEACCKQTETAEYYFDTSAYMIFWDNVEFPLYKKDIETGGVYYLGTTGYEFQLFGSYIYIKSDIYMEDYPQGEVTRVIDLETGVITPFGRNVNIFIPSEDDTVYFTYDMVGSIYRADASLIHIRELSIEVPEQDEIEEACEGMFDVYEDASITNVEDGWIYFLYSTAIYEAGPVYEGNYRIRTDGTGLEKTDEGVFYDE